MKIILFIDSLANGGSQRQFVNLAIGLHRRGHDIGVITYAPADFYLSDLLDEGIAVDCLDKKGRFDVRPFWRLAAVIRSNRAEVVVAFLRTPGVYAEIAGLVCPATRIIVSERAGIVGSGLGASQYIAGLCHSLATAVTGNSHHYLDHLVSRLAWLKKKSTVIYNGVDDRFFVRGRAGFAGKSSLSRGEDESLVKICVVATRVIEDKGLMPLLGAVLLLSNRSIANFSVSWVGEAVPGNPLVDQANEFIEQYGLGAFWSWAGEHEDMATCYGNYDLLVLPSLHEGVPNALCEAMASGLPVVATDISDNGRIIEPGVNGFLCRAGDAESLADAMERVLELSCNKRLAMGRAAFRTADRLFSLDGFVKRWEEVLR